jgi:hypothetical protein
MAAGNPCQRGNHPDRVRILRQAGRIMPAAACAQALVSGYAHRYEVVTSPLVGEPPPGRVEAAESGSAR